MIRLIPLLFALGISAGTANAACYADYKAKQDDPLRLHYGVAELPDSACNPQAAAGLIAERLQDGWQLLNIVSVFGPEGLDQRRASAGPYFLRY
ncbi:hypothetical protein [Jannaschia sp. M317]|uniref:hypothetical protein n=1 Tax=Jannaschia sp. M317 TaxID=2867011 RepID=UPI0021A52AE1|nr:hypothetical protein [Jannaschia sp. M317]UWQ18272.1 hypothetical protein K3551_02905 [Jannaschia sp. M317]